MAARELSRKKIEEIREIARGWGRLLAREAYPDGPGLHVSLAEMEEIAVTASGGWPYGGARPPWTSRWGIARRVVEIFPSAASVED